MEIKNLRKRIFLPVLLLFLLLTIIPFILANIFSTYLLNREADAHVHAVKSTMKLIVKDDLLLLSSHMDSIEKNRLIIQSWRKKDRNKLNSYSYEIFRTMSRRYRISYFSFHDTARVNFLRVHKPGIYGDLIFREGVERSSDKKTQICGLELGQEGELIYRVIRPWFIEGKLTGYIELGISFDDVIPRITDILPVDVVITIKKKIIRRSDWENIRRKNRKIHNWDKYSSFVILKTTLNRKDVSLNEKIATIVNYYNNKGLLYRAEIGSKMFSCGQFKLVDITGRYIGNVLVISKISERIRQLTVFKAVFLALVVLGSVLILLVFWKYFGKIENELYTAHGMSESLLSAVSNPMMIIDVDYGINNLNRYTEKLLNSESADLIKKNLFEIKIPWDNRIVHEILERVKKTGEPLRGCELAFNKERIMGISIYPINDPEGKISGFLLTGLDITEKKITENKKNIEQKLVSLGELSAGVAHEINTPSQYIMSNLDFIKKSLKEIKVLYSKFTAVLDGLNNSGSLRKKQFTEITEYIEKSEIDYLFSEIPGAINQSQEGIDHITKIVKSMKSFARPDIGDKVKVNLNEMIGDVITISRNEWKYSAEMISDLNDEFLEIICNPAEINQTILELIINSSHAISEKIKNGIYEKGIIEISAKREGNKALIIVKDDGTGIPEDDKSRIFDPFFTTKDVGEGTGSGLSYVYTTIVRSHGGSIDIHSDKDTGTEFKIRLPVSEKI